ncbi:tRNA-dihydrouridine synthase family protein [Geovibrio thiophilus]|uniref:tRNA-dihydrouridine synthase n=1 Tax=Geovibrio thiophilus TaxID=139438 RepID=A0A3R5V0X4_9BACT|nr:tRNA-dihydrouridine synthase [Geovibrio thiophilus]QAR32907.1 tRNA-dihydrouridine synthase family protein [Geovibrio thiophilus]
MTLSRKSDNIITESLKKNVFVAAPMAGVSTPPFRLAVRDFFDGIIFSEMVSVEGLIRGGKKTLEYVRLTERDNPYALQLFGSRPESIHDAIKICDEHSNADFYDINMGCPVKKVLKSGSGAALLKDTVKIREIIKAARKATDKPLTVKIRLGWDRGSINYPEVLEIAAGEGIDAVSLHGRTKSEMFSGEVDYAMIADAVKRSPIPVIGNGNVADTESCRRMRETGAAGVMIGRGMMKAPWIFKALSEGKDPDGFLTPREIHSLIYRMIRYEALYREEKYYSDAIKKYAVWFTKGLPESSVFRTEIYTTKTMTETTELIDRYFENIPVL